MQAQPPFSFQQCLAARPVHCCNHGRSRCYERLDERQCVPPADSQPSQQGQGAGHKSGRPHADAPIVPRAGSPMASANRMLPRRSSRKRDGAKALPALARRPPLQVCCSYATGGCGPPGIRAGEDRDEEGIKRGSRVTKLAAGNSCASNRPCPPFTPLGLAGPPPRLCLCVSAWGVWGKTGESQYPGCKGPCHGEERSITQEDRKDVSLESSRQERSQASCVEGRYFPRLHAATWAKQTRQKGSQTFVPTKGRGALRRVKMALLHEIDSISLLLTCGFAASDSYLVCLRVLSGLPFFGRLSCRLHRVLHSSRPVRKHWHGDARTKTSTWKGEL